MKNIMLERGGGMEKEKRKSEKIRVFTHEKEVEDTERITDNVINY